MQKVDGSSPFIRLGVEPNQPLSAFGRAPQMPQPDVLILERLGAVTKRIESLWTIRRDRFESVDATARQIRERDVGVIHVQRAAADGSSSASAASEREAFADAPHLIRDEPGRAVTATEPTELLVWSFAP